ncbi:MAG: hypothetical protein SGILL_001612 [Bacillariaceae sp.]
MVQGLGFLSKKSWHTKNLSNQKRVWEEEQKQEAEASKTKELAKQIQQEREQEELDRIAGKKSTMDRGIDWMYQGGTQGDLAKQDAEKKSEEYLLGKEFVGDGAVTGDFDDGDQKQGINSVLKAPPPDDGNLKPAAVPSAAGYAEPSVHDRNENFRLRNEDPMFFVSRKVREKERNRDHTKELYERVVGVPGEDAGSITDSRGKKRSKKEKKRDKKNKRKKSSRRQHDDDYDDYSDDDSHRRRHKKHRKRRHRSRSRSSSRNRSRSRSDSRDRHDRHHHTKHSSRGDRGYNSRSEDSYDDRRRHGRKDRRDNRHHRRYEEDDRRMAYRRGDDRGRDEYDRRDRKERHHHERRDSKDPPRKSEPETKRLEGYGLKGAPAPKIDGNDLGPDREQLRQKREARESEKRRNAGISQTRKRSSQEDRQRALQEMQEDARKREERKGRQVSYRKKEADDDKAAGRSSNGSFLNDITKNTHGIAGEGSLSSRVAQNRHTNQRLHDSFF